MWKLELVDNEILSGYSKKILSGLKSRIISGVNGICLDDWMIEILIPNYDKPNEDNSVINKLLISEPQELMSHCNSLMSKIVKNYDVNELQTYIVSVRKQPENRNSVENDIVNRYDEVLNKLLRIFDYEGQISSNKKLSYWLTRNKGTNVCTYCNRQYTFTVETDDGKKIARPDLDHWFSKQAYPLMSLSFYNLIPSCHICNSSAKGNTLFDFDNYIHPYLQQDYNPPIRFRKKLCGYNQWSVDIERNINSPEDKTVKAFYLDDIYSYHGPLEVKDLIDFNSSFSSEYLKILFEKIMGDAYEEKTQVEVYRMLFGTELCHKDFGKRPLSKLKYDILKDLGII